MVTPRARNRSGTEQELVDAVGSRLHGDFDGLDIDTEAGWAVVEDVIHTIAHRTIETPAEHTPPATTTHRKPDD